MEVKSNTVTQVVSLEGTTFSADITVMNGVIKPSTINIALGGEMFGIDLDERLIRELHKEFTSLISFVDSQKGVGSV